MNKLRILRNILLIFIIVFISILLVSLLWGATITQKRLLSILVIAAIDAIMAIVLFIDTLAYKINYMIIQIVYVIMLNVVYIAVMIIMGVEFTSYKVFFYNLFVTSFIFLAIRTIMYKINQNTAQKINESLKYHRENRIHKKSD
jgi:hypothetical protein